MSIYSHNDEAKAILRNLENYSKLVDNISRSLLHYSVKYDDAVMTQHLIDEGLDVNVQDNNGTTPLILALTKESVAIVEVLLKNNADIYLADRYGVNALQYAVYNRFHSPVICPKQKRHIILEMFFDRVNKDFFRRKNEMMQLMLNANQTIKLAAVAIGSVAVTKFILKNGYPIDYRERDTRASSWAMIFAKPKNVKLLIEHEPNVISPIYGFGDYYNKNIAQLDEESKVLKVWLQFAKSRWAILSKDERRYVKRERENLLRNGNKETVRAVLESEFDVTTMKFSSGRNFLILLFGNRNADVIDVLEDINFKFKKNTVNFYIPTVLSAAEYLGNVRNLDFLLKHGADVELLWAEWNADLYPTWASRQKSIDIKQEINFAKIAELLLQNGINAQTVFDDGKSIVDKLAICNKSPVTKLILAHLALLGSLEQPTLTSFNYNKILSILIFKTHFDLCTKQLQEMKNIKVHGNMSLFQLLTEDEEKIVPYARNPELIPAFNSTIKSVSHLESYYINSLKKRIAKALDKVELERKVASVIANLTGLCYDAYHIIIYRIISYLSLYDLNNLSEIKKIKIRLQ